jgi:hypothetical protein
MDGYVTKQPGLDGVDDDPDGRVVADWSVTGRSVAAYLYRDIPSRSFLLPAG